MLSPTLSQKRPPLSWSSPCSALVKGVVPSQVCIPASLASLVLHNPDSLCYLNAAVFLLAYVSAHWKPNGPLQGATPLEHSLYAISCAERPVGSRDGLTLTDIPEWSSLLQSWSSLHQQQDCMELIRHFLTKTACPTYSAGGQRGPFLDLWRLEPKTLPCRSA